MTVSFLKKRQQRRLLAGIAGSGIYMIVYWLIAATGAVECIITALALRDGFLPATIGYREPDADCDLDIIPNEGRSKQVDFALSNSLGFGGHNACLVLNRPEKGVKHADEH